MHAPGQFSEFAALLERFFASSLEDPKSQPGDIGDSAFDTLALQLFNLQYAMNPTYHAWCQSLGIAPAEVRTWKQIPALPIVAFKEAEVTSIPPGERICQFHSSGTTGRGGSRHYHNQASLRLYELSCWPWFLRHVLQGEFQGTRELLCLTPPPSLAPHSSLVHMFEVVRQKLHAPASVFHGNVSASGEWLLDIDLSVLELERIASKNLKVDILITAFSIVHLIEAMEQQGRRIKLPPGSVIMETGGYKGRSKELSREELYRRITSTLGIPNESIVSEYGMSELSSQAYDTIAGTKSTHRLFRFPPWARFRIINPETGHEASEGQVGLIQVFDLANVYSAMAIQTEDLGRRYGDGFEMLGRAQAAEPRGCSLMPG